MNAAVPEGYYDALLTSGLRRDVAGSGLVPTIAAVEPDEAVESLARHLQHVARTVLAATKGDRRMRLVDELIQRLGSPDELLGGELQRLESLLAEAVPGTPLRYPYGPQAPLSRPALLTNAHGEPTMGSEIAAELGSADRVELLCAFIKWHGIRTLEAPLRALRERGVEFRVITSTYLGATERKALDRLVSDFGAQVRISYETQRTRLHAKAWRFLRDTGFDTAYVGSSNLSQTALLDGVEWNVRLTVATTPELLDKFGATFETYWNDPAFERYTPDDAERLDDALAVAAGGGRRPEALHLSGLEVRPWPHQERILEALQVERVVHDRHRNLVVAATGTGKTVVAALDYARIAREVGRLPTLLFVAHRKEILEQAQRTYREVLADGAFGELQMGGLRPVRRQQVFASVQSLSAEAVRDLPPDGFDVVVVDEFHHAEAASYRRILDHFRPNELLGLTATPERADGVDVRSFFDGRAAYEMRLWDALASDLLVPFHYFGIADATDLSQVQFRRGAYDVEGLSQVFTGNDARTRIILRQVADKIADPARMRALGFCAGVAHAQYMAERFRGQGLPAVALHGGTDPVERATAIRRLRAGELVAIFTADLFNEGVDIPEVDVVLFLRPTDSATIFLQQLGRGLRRTSNKAVLTVLDFVGHHRKEFNLAQRYRSIVGGSRKALERQVEHGFPYLPSGTQIVLDDVTQRQVLDNIRSQVRGRWSQLVAEQRAIGDVGLSRFLAEADVELPDLLLRGSLTGLRRAAGLPTRDGGGLEDYLLNRLRVLAHVDDRDRNVMYRRLLADDAPTFEDLGDEARMFAQMLFFALWPDRGGFGSVAEGLAALRKERAFRDEAVQVLDWAFEGSEHLAAPLLGRLHGLPLRSHARYTREELAAALGYVTADRAPNSLREGVFHSKGLDVDVLLVTLVKSEQHFSPTTMYRDYAVNSELFHWESQSTTSVASPTGQRYLNQRRNGTEVLLFCREAKTSAFGSGAPYLLLGPADYVEHRGERPISITWRLRRPMPADLLSAARAVS